MIVFPNCKINIGLYVTNKRNDGYHDIETVFFPLPLTDALEIIPSPEQDEEVVFTMSGIKIAGSTIDNLCVKAYRLLKEQFPALPPVKMHLHKVIPIGAGLGGGSADGAYALSLIKKYFQLPLSDDEMMQYALQLGSDCPFFLINKPVFASGRGENFKDVQLPIDLLNDYKICIVNPRIHIHTGLAFAGITPAQPSYNLRQSVSLPIAEWKSTIFNQFETTVFAKYPEIEKIKNEMYNNGAVYASMSGTGSTVYGFFKAKEPLLFDFPVHYTTIWI